MATGIGWIGLYCGSARRRSMLATLVGMPDSVSSAARRSTTSSRSSFSSCFSSWGSMVTTSDVRLSTSTRPLASRRRPRGRFLLDVPRTRLLAASSSPLSGAITCR